MKKMIIIAVIIAMLIGGSSGTLWDIADMFQGRQMIPSGAPWIPDGGALYFGTGKDANLKYDAAMDKIYLNDTPVYLEEAVTLGGGLSGDPAGIIDEAYGLTTSSNKIRMNVSPDKGLEYASGGSLQALAGDGVDLGATGIAVDVTDFIDTNYGLTENANDIRLNIVADKGLEFSTGALQIELDGTTLVAGSSGLKVNPAGSPTVASITVTGSIRQGTTTTAVDTTISDTGSDFYFVGNGTASQTITMPTVADNAGRVIAIMVTTDPSTNNVVIDGENSEQVDGANTKTTTDAVGSYYYLISDGTAWRKFNSAGTWT